MKLIRTARIKLDKSDAFQASIKAYTIAFNYICGIGFADSDFNGISLHHKTYQYCRQTFGLPSQLTISARTKAAESLKGIRALKKKGNKVSCPKSKFCSIRLDQNSYSLFLDKGEASILTISGRQKFKLNIPQHYKEFFKSWKHASADLKVDRKGQPWLHISFTKDIEDPKTNLNGKFVGIDRGLKKLAVTSERQFFGGGKVKQHKKRISRLRSNLQACDSKSAKRHLKKLNLKERRFMADINHCISKQIVSKLQLGDTIVLEKLTGIKTRANRFRKAQRAEINQWAFLQLETFIKYKSEAKGINIEYIDARYTSQSCNKCGHTEKANRKCQSIFACKACGYRLNADLNAAFNIRSKHMVSIEHPDAKSYLDRAEVNQPIVEGNVPKGTEPIYKPTTSVVGN